MNYRVVFYSPDRHIVYNGRTPFEVGVGGGITARVRMSRALARLGHEVVMVANCPRHEWIDAVEYVPLDDVRRLEGDVFIANTSGGGYDLSSLPGVRLEFVMQIVWTSGTARPRGLEHSRIDLIYAKSNFLRGVVRGEWQVPFVPIFVAYNGFEESLFDEAERCALVREPHRLVYFSHPSKGLEAAIDVSRRLREVDPRFHLVVFGGPRLWGEREGALPGADGVDYRGLIGQGELAAELLRCSFSLHLQSRLEPFGMALTEAMRAGLIALASPVGAHPEIVRDKVDGLLVEGDVASPAAAGTAADRILELFDRPERLDLIRAAARHVPWSSDLMARVWTDHWSWWIGRGRGASMNPMRYGPHRCADCAGGIIILADGGHCMQCGLYARLKDPIEEALSSEAGELIPNLNLRL